MTTVPYRARVRQYWSPRVRRSAGWLTERTPARLASPTPGCDHLVERLGRTLLIVLLGGGHGCGARLSCRVGAGSTGRGFLGLVGFGSVLVRVLAGRGLW